MTGMVCLITGIYNAPRVPGTAGNGGRGSDDGGAWDSFFPGARYILAVAVVFFAYSTMISWSYYGERAWEYLFGARSTLVYRVIFVWFVFMGSVAALGNVLDFSDMMILGMAFPNIIGGVILSPQIKAVLEEYWKRLKSGEMVDYR